jgi:hypothetical protein
MKTAKHLFTCMAFILAITLVLAPSQGLAKNNKNQNQNGQYGNGAGMNFVVSGLPAEELSVEEETGLILMREEEKLARDVYTFLYEKWQAPIFDHIAMSEQRHMNAIKLLIDKYGLVDPVTDPTAGAFTNPQMLALYNQFTAQGALSLIDALKVGATIEDLDIKDLQELIAQTDNADIALVYENLLQGSRSHLRAFAYRLSLLGVTYEAQYITPEELEDIITSPMETGNGNGKDDSAPGTKVQAAGNIGMNGNGETRPNR